MLHYTTPAHGTLATGSWGTVYYTPAAGFRGLDTFSYSWTYNLLDYNGQSKGEASTNHAQVGVPAGNGWT